MVRLGLCCTFLDAPIKFRHTTVRYVTSLANRTEFLDEIARHNVAALRDAIAWCTSHGIGAFRVLSQLLPLYTHPVVGWKLADKPALQQALREAGAEAARADVRLSFHPDQFVVLGSTSEATVASSIAELEYTAEVGALLGAAQMTVHGGGAQGGKAEALARFERGFARLSPAARALLVLENDDRVYTVEDLLPTCKHLTIPLVYDVHHHRCNPDRLDVLRATELCAATWRGREPWAHVSSPVDGWKGSDPRPHADHIALRDVPTAWLERTMTIDVEAKAKERAVLALQKRLVAKQRRLAS